MVFIKVANIYTSSPVIISIPTTPIRSFMLSASFAMDYKDKPAHYNGTEMSLKDRIGKCFLFYVGVGSILWVADGIYNMVKKEGELDITFWRPAYETVYLKDPDRIERVWELIDRYRKLNKVAWLGTFKYAYKPGDECIVELWDRKGDVRASVCRSATKGWYLMYEGDGYKSIPAYYRLSEKEAVGLMERIREVVE